MIAKKPPMGWNTWNTFGREISDELVRQTADVMVQSGLLECGYNYLVIDDCWAEKQRDENGRLVPDRQKFPHGMKALADYVHSKGLKFGMYSCAGARTCDDYPGSFEYEFIDAATFAEWGVDYLKYDYCFKAKNVPGVLLYTRMATALATCGRDILFAACSWGADDIHRWIAQTGAHTWRSTADINDNWQSIYKILTEQKALLPYGGMNCFNDMDMLVVGMQGKGLVGLGGCSIEEYRTHFSAWALLGSPLIIGCDIREMSNEVKAILTNKDLIAINQDPACRAARMIPPESDMFKVAKTLEGGDIAIGLFNLTDKVAMAYVSPYDLGFDRSCNIGLEIYDVWEQKSLGLCKDGIIEKEIPPHQCKVYRAKIVKL